MPHGVLVPREVRAEFWGLVRSGISPAWAAVELGASRDAGDKWFRDAGGVKPTLPKPGPRVRRPLTLEERETIALMRAGKSPVRAIARAIGRCPSVVSRELGRNTSTRGLYRPLGAQKAAEVRARRPKTAKLAVPGPLRDYVVEKLGEDWSPRQIANVLAVEHPDDPEQRVCAETIYQSIYVQSRGALKKELAAHLRRGRTQRKPQTRPEERRGKLPGTLPISQRDAEAEDRAVPGHWEGDLIMGRNNGSAIGTLVERATRFALLIYLPGRHGAQEFHDAIIPTLNALPGELRRSLTWDNGKEMAMHHQITMATGMADLLRRPPLTVAARLEREHQRTAAPVLPQGRQPAPVHPRRPHRGSPQAQQPTPRDPRLAHPRPGPQRTTLRAVQDARCCLDRQTPPRESRGDPQKLDYAAARFGATVADPARTARQTGRPPCQTPATSGHAGPVGEVQVRRRRRAAPGRPAPRRQPPTSRGPSAAAPPAVAAHSASAGVIPISRTASAMHSGSELVKHEPGVAVGRQRHRDAGVEQRARASG